MAKGLLVICCIQLTVFLLISQVVEVSSEGTLTIAFVKYINPEGKGANGHCCDGRWGMCTSECDHMFTLCLDDIKSPNETHPCTVNKTETAAYKNQNTIVFGDDIGGLDNPMVWHMRPLLTAISLKIAVWDKDKTGSNDYVDFLRLDLGKRPNELQIGRWYTFNITHRTIMEVQVRFDCTNNYYGPKCSVQCRPPGSGQHFTCDQRTGRKNCDLGWEGPTCSTKSDMCGPTSCQNGGSCTWHNGQEYCDCSPEFSGPRCEEDKCNEWCNPGKCGRWSPGPNGYMCICPSGYEAVQQSGAGAQCKWKEPGRGSDKGGGGSSSNGGGGSQGGGGYGGGSQGGGGGSQGGGGGSHGGSRNEDCDQLARNGYRYIDGVYEVQVGSGRPFNVYCDMTSDGSGWTVLMRRSSGETDFYRGWRDYEEGFGEAGENSDHWIGLENMYEMTKNRNYKLRVDMQTQDYRNFYAEYDQFSIGSGSTRYELNVGRYSGNAGDALGLSGPGEDPSMSHNRMAFSTFDRDDDGWHQGNCARDFKSGWWFNACFAANLNGKYWSSRQPCQDAMCVQWRTLPGYEDYSLKSVTMKIKPT